MKGSVGISPAHQDLMYQRVRKEIRLIAMEIPLVQCQALANNEDHLQPEQHDQRAGRRIPDQDYYNMFDERNRLSSTNKTILQINKMIKKFLVDLGVMIGATESSMDGGH
jgi:hypothetical protein